MKTELYAKNYKISDRLEHILTMKIGKLDKYFPNDTAKAKAVLSDNGKQCKLEITVLYEGMQIRSEAVGKTMYYNVDECLPKLERQIVKHREKLSQKRKLPAIDNDFEFVSDVDDEPVKITKKKEFPIERMSVSDAAEGLDMVDHDFYIFVNAENDNVEVVYKRKDGTVGHLKPYTEK